MILIVCGVIIGLALVFAVGRYSGMRAIPYVLAMMTEEELDELANRVAQVRGARHDVVT